MQASGVIPLMRSAIVNGNRAIGLVFRGVALGVRAAPREAAAMVVFALATGATPTLIAFLQKGLIDHFFRVAQHEASAWTTYVVFATIAIYILATITDASESANVFAMTALGDKVGGVAKERLFQRLANEPSLEPFERSEWLDGLNLAYQAIPRMQAMSNRFASLLRGLFFAVPALVACFTIAWWIPLVLVVTLVPTGIAEFRIEGKVWDAEKTLGEKRRKQNLIEETLTRPAFAKDLRLLTLGDTLTRQWHSLFMANMNLINAIRLKGMRRTLLWGLFGGLGVGVPVVYIVNGVADGSRSVGELVLFLSVCYLVRAGVQNLIWASSEIAGMTLAMDHYEQFLAKGSDTVRTHETQRDVAPLRRALSFDAVTFRYPGNSEPSAADITLTIDAGSTVAIVGENGAGKSTLAKLLGRLYEPSTGRIIWDDSDVSTIMIDAYRVRLGFMAQDIAEFPFSLRENLSFARLGNPPSDDELHAVLAETGLGELAARSAWGLDTPLTKELDGGTQLSGGQWQRLALARVMLRAADADLLVLDEPTAAFDPAAEHALIERLLEVARGKTAIIITHRLAVCTEVDRVIVMHGGRVIEDGTHQELVAAGGHYAAMFEAQARRYRDSGLTEQSESPDS